MSEKIPTGINLSKLSDESGHVEHDEYYRSLGERGERRLPMPNLEFVSVERERES